MASPTTDGSVIQNAWTNTSSSTATLTTTKVNDLIFLVVAMSHASSLPTVSTVSDVAGLTWTKRKAWTVTGSAADIALEIWTAPSTGILTADVITVTASVTVNSGLIIACGLNGTNALATPFDTDAGLPYENQATNVSTDPSVTFSTAKADDLLLGVAMGDKSGAQGAAPSGWTQVQANTHFGSSRFCALGLYFKSVSATQSSASFAPGGSFSNGDSITAVDAVTADSPTVNYSLSITTGAYTIAGQATALHVGRNIAPTTGAYAIAGIATAFAKTLKIAPTTGAYSIGGQAVLFSGVRTLSAATGAYVVGGVAAAGKVGHTLVAVTGAYLINGQAVSLLSGKRISAVTGAYVIAGQATAFEKALHLAPATGAYLIDGQDADFTVVAMYHSTFADFNNTAFLDWGSADFESFLVISQTDESVDTKEQAPYIYTFLKQTEDSDEDSEGATLTGYWDWANDSTSKRVTQPQEIYHFRDGFLVCARRHKMRGRGRQLQLRYDSVTGKNFNLLGWALFYVHNAQQ